MLVVLALRPGLVKKACGTSSRPSELTLSCAMSSPGSAKDFLRDFFFFPPLWFLRLREG
jgi:hypothetical protein